MVDKNTIHEIVEFQMGCWMNMNMNTKEISQDTISKAYKHFYDETKALLSDPAVEQMPVIDCADDTPLHARMIILTKLDETIINRVTAEPGITVKNLKIELPNYSNTHIMGALNHLFNIGKIYST